MRIWLVPGKVGLAAVLALSAFAVAGCRTGISSQAPAPTGPAGQTSQTERGDSATTPAAAPCRFG